MPLPESRVTRVGTSPHAHEREGIEFALAALPDRDPLHAWTLFDLLDPSTGRLHEIDLLVLGPNALYVVELKAYEGILHGDSRDWQHTPSRGIARYRENPRFATQRKAQILRSRLMSTAPAASQIPWVEPLVFLTGQMLTVELTRDGQTGVVARKDFAEAILHHRIPGVEEPRRGRLTRAHLHAVKHALDKLGIRARKRLMVAGVYQLADILVDTDAYQDRLAVHQDFPDQKRRARTYLVPQQTSVERRQQLLRAADREAQLLYEVREHPNIVTYLDYHRDAPPGPTVLLDAFENGVALDIFLRREPDLPFADRVALVEQVGRAIDHCHKKGIVHGGLAPAAVLVRRNTESLAIESRLHDFQLAAGRAIEGTRHTSALGIEGHALYRAPELADDSTPATPLSDIYSLGALAFLIVTGQPAGRTLREVEAHLARHLCLDPSAVSDAIPAGVAALVRQATALTFTNRSSDRIDHAGAWIDLLVESGRPPASRAAAEPSPLDAMEGDVLGGDLLVEGVLGHGASARVLLVLRESDDRSLALKISLGPDQDVRLRAEAALLRDLNRPGHPRIVTLLDERVLSGRPCLLLTLAGDDMLHRLLARTGSLSLDLAARYGDELMEALEYLESAGVVHRDIKPANLGVGDVGKRGQHLTMFDFSLAAAPPTDVDVGTAAYRDPFLRARGRWDAAADRYAAAVVLHEMLTGVRPSHGGPGGSALDPEAPLVIAAERIDPSVRELLAALFTRALARDADARFDSAADLRAAFRAALEPPAPAPPVRAAAAEPSPAPLSDEAVAGIGPDTPIDALPLSARARNALDRAGLTRAADLLSLPDNRLSAMRGVGAQVAEDILAFRDRWRQLRADLAPAQISPFFPGYRGDDLHLGSCALEPRAAVILVDAGLASLGAVAGAPRAHLEALTRRHGLDLAPLEGILAGENRRASERARPTTLEGWIDALFRARRTRTARLVRALFGLEGAEAGRIDLGAREAAVAQKVTPAAVYQALAKLRAAWAAHPAIGELTEPCRALVTAAGGAASLARLADDLLAVLPHDRSADARMLRAAAAALLRVVVEVEHQEPGGLAAARLEPGGLWILAGADLAPVVRRLGEVADELAARPLVAGAGEAGRLLIAAADESLLAGLLPDRLAAIAAAASRTAACSARLEIYPRGLTGARALELSRQVVTDGLSAEEIVQRVSARYPDAEPLPPRPALDRLLEPHRLRFDDATGQTVRTDRAAGPTYHTSVASLTEVSSTPPRGASPPPELVARAELDARLRATLERRRLLVLGVPADRAPLAERALARGFALEPTSFDRVFLAALDARARRHQVTPAKIIDTDRAGPSGADWPRLLELAGLAAGDVAGELLPPREPLLVTRPGLIARYHLTEFLRRLVTAAGDEAAHAIFLLVPSHAEAGAPRLGDVSIPGLLPGQSAWLTGPWLAAHSRSMPAS